MNKRIMMLALAITSTALFALPSVASAQTWHLNSSNASITISGSGGQLTSTAGGSINCTATSGGGSFSTSTTGSTSLVFSGCKGPLGVSCSTSPTSAVGVISATTEFHAIMVATQKPGLLLTGQQTNSATPSKGSQLAEFSCLGLTVKVYGNGLIGTISGPAECGTASSDWDMTFGSTQAGHQEDKMYTGVTYDLESTITASHPTMSFDGSISMHFSNVFNPTATCTH